MKILKNFLNFLKKHLILCKIQYIIKTGIRGKLNLLGGFLKFMQKEINNFISYLHNIKKTSNNTEL